MSRFAVLLVVVGAVVLGAGSLDSAAGQEPAAWRLSADCAPDVPGIQTDCDYKLGDAIDVAIVLENLSGPSTALGSFSFDIVGGIVSDDPSSNLKQGSEVVTPAAGEDENLNGNPDFSEATVPGTWDCSEPPPSAAVTGPVNFIASIACSGEGGPVVAPGSSIVLAALHLTATGSPGAASIGARVPTFTSGDGASLIVNCRFGTSGTTDPQMSECPGATVWIDRTTSAPPSGEPTVAPTTQPPAPPAPETTISAPTTGGAAGGATLPRTGHGSDRGYSPALPVVVAVVGLMALVGGAAVAQAIERECVKRYRK